MRAKLRAMLRGAATIFDLSGSASRQPARTSPAEAVGALWRVPQADYSSAWTELRGYVAEAVRDGRALDAAALLRYMDELRHAALAPVREWMRETGAPGEGDQS